MNLLVQTLNIVVDPDDLVTEDNNKTNNIASVEVFIGRTPTAQITVVDEVFTFENVTLTLLLALTKMVVT